jgi:hypothetical protein
MMSRFTVPAYQTRHWAATGSCSSVSDELKERMSAGRQPITARAKNSVVHCPTELRWLATWLNRAR